MRAIKFRGRDEDGQWRYGFLSWYTNVLAYINDGTDWEVSPETVGQYTGLKDAVGREIYEGDIIQNEDLFPHTRGVVCYDAYLTRFYIDTGDGDINDLRQDEENCVIGNVHDNHELLEVEHD